MTDKQSPIAIFEAKVVDPLYLRLGVEVADSAVVNKNTFPFAISNKKRKKYSSGKIEELFFSSYIRLNVKDKYGVLSDVTKIFSNNKVSIKRVLQNPYKNKKKSSIVIITHRSKDNDIQKTLKTLAKKSYIIRKPKLLRIENG